MYIRASAARHNKAGRSVVGYFRRCSTLFRASLATRKTAQNATSVTLLTRERANKRARVYTCQYPFPSLEKAQATGKKFEYEADNQMRRDEIRLTFWAARTGILADRTPHVAACTRSCHRNSLLTKPPSRPASSFKSP